MLLHHQVLFVATKMDIYDRNVTCLISDLHIRRCRRRLSLQASSSANDHSYTNVTPLDILKTTSGLFLGVFMGTKKIYIFLRQAAAMFVKTKLGVTNEITIAVDGQQ